jgi:hypothetical protein
MKELSCCGRPMYQEITKENKLISICKKCGKTITLAISFSGYKEKEA